MNIQDVNEFSINTIGRHLLKWLTEMKGRNFDWCEFLEEWQIFNLWTALKVNEGFFTCRGSTRSTKNTQMYITILTVRGYILTYPSQPKGRSTFGFGLLKPRLNDFKFWNAWWVEKFWFEFHLVFHYSCIQIFKSHKFIWKIHIKQTETKKITLNLKGERLKRWNLLPF